MVEVCGDDSQALPVTPRPVFLQHSSCSCLRSLFGIACYCMVLFGIAWYCMVLYGIATQFMLVPFEITIVRKLEVYAAACTNEYLKYERRKICLKKTIYGSFPHLHRHQYMLKNIILIHTDFTYFICPFYKLHQK